MSTAERQRRHRAVMTERGFIQLTLWIPAGEEDEYKTMAGLSRENHELDRQREAEREAERKTAKRRKKSC